MGKTKEEVGRQRQRVDRTDLSRVTVRGMGGGGGGGDGEDEGKRWEDNVRGWTGLTFPESL